ncbi:MAG: ABC transporter permease [Flavobacteriaceae bacterium]|nr:ABC transporter permease [Flavobacteriaceae bacterium]
MLSLFLARKLRLQGSFTTAILRLAVAAIGLSVSVMLASVCIVRGFRHEIRSKVTGFASHVQISTARENDTYETIPIVCDELLLDSLSKLPGVAAAQPYAYKPGIIKTKEALEGIVLKGLSPRHSLKFFAENMVAGKLPNLALDSIPNKDLLLSQTTASRMGLSTGSKVNIYFAGERLKARPFIVCGIYETGLEEFDKTFALCQLGHINKLNNWLPDEASGVELLLDDPEQTEVITENIHTNLPPELSAKSMYELYPQIFEWLALVDSNVYILLALMSGVAIISIITALIVLLIERTPMVGLLKSLGASNSLIRRVFMALGGRLVLGGLFWGNLCGLAICFLQREYHFISLDQSSYYMRFVPVSIQWPDVLTINLGCFVVCYLFLIIPAAVIGRVSPLSAIKFR